MQTYDVIIVGAGPAGGQCARELAQSGANVLLIDKAKDFSINNFSSAGAPNDILSNYNLPESIVATHWSKLHMHSSHNDYTWDSPTPVGVVLDFMKLRSFLSAETTKAGGQTKLGLIYVNHSHTQEHVEVTLKNTQTQKEEKYHCRVLVDATGCERQVLAKKTNKNKAVIATGIEHLIEVPPDIYQRHSDSLCFYLGRKWMPQGYAWIFPMEENKLKVGVGRYFQNETIVPHIKSYHFYLDHLIQQTLGRSEFKTLDKHGKTLTYTYGQKDPHYDRNVIAIGDSISSVNPLAFEGIRHAMASGKIAAKHIQQHLNGSESSFSPYSRDMRKYFGWKWYICEKLMHVIYRQPDENKVDLMLKTFQNFSYPEMMELCFQYKPSLLIRFLFNYLVKSR